MRNYVISASGGKPSLFSWFWYRTSYRVSDRNIT